MPKIDISALLTDITNAAKGSLEKDWPKVKGNVVQKLKTLAENVAYIEKMKLEGKMTKKEATLHLNIQRNAVETVLLTQKGLGKIAVENALNAVFNVVGEAIKLATGWVI